MLSGKIEEVNSTKIFARLSLDGKGRDRQWLVYAMHLDTPSDVAMILPIPVKVGVGEDDVEFEDLSKRVEFFKKLEVLFPDKHRMRGMTKGYGSDSLGFDTLKVHAVGAFEASFAPTMADMDRLDPRFNLPKKTWDKLPQYKDFGFVVFKLSKGDAERHPMSFSFTSRFNDRLFFPTVHVHDQEVHEVEEFDHKLYAQGLKESGIWERSIRPLDGIERRYSKAMTDLHVFKAELEGELLNEDTYVNL
jgi:hypothetical protein